MQREHALVALTRLAGPTDGVFRGAAAVGAGVTRPQLTRLVERGLVERVLPDTYRLSAWPRSARQSLTAALTWAGGTSAATGRSAGAQYRLDGVVAGRAEIVVPRPMRVPRDCDVAVHVADRRVVMPRRVAGVPCSGIEFTLLRLAAVLDDEAFEIAFEDARRRGLTSVAAVGAYLDRFASSGRPGVRALRTALRDLDQAQPARSTLEVKTRRLLAQHGLTGFVREFPLAWNGRTYRYDFAFPRARVILETNGRRWHDDATDFERDQETWSVPGRHGYRLVFATWATVTGRPEDLVAELRVALSWGAIGR